MRSPTNKTFRHAEQHQRIAVLIFQFQFLGRSCGAGSSFCLAKGDKNIQANLDIEHHFAYSFFASNAYVVRSAAILL